jgi:hypothetical protein
MPNPAVPKPWGNLGFNAPIQTHAMGGAIAVPPPAAVIQTILQEWDEEFLEEKTAVETNKDLPISKLFPFAPLTVEKAKHLAYEQLQPANQYKVINETALVGIEIEVENITDTIPITHYWQVKTDGSLRNNGFEFTSLPIRGKQIEPAMRHLSKALRQYNNPDFSIRTSCHVHLNVRDMTWDQIKTLVLLYAIFERHFFYVAGTKREESIFCVPIYKTQILQHLDSFQTRWNLWHKYCALNLIPILGKDDTKRYGTVEFRHLYGTDDVETIVQWCNHIFCLRQATQKYKYEELKEKIKTLNTTSEYIALYTDVFGEYADLRKMVKHDFEYCISQAKKEIFGKEYQDKLKFSKTSAAYSLMALVGVV